MEQANASTNVFFHTKCCLKIGLVCLFSATCFGVLLVNRRVPIVRLTNSPPIIYSLSVDISGCEGNIGNVSSDISVPIFIMTRDRLSSLRQAIASYKRLSSLGELIICDHNSSYPPMIKYLDELKASGIEVWHLLGKHFRNALEEIADKITNYLKQRPHFKFYVVTDPDIGLNGTAPDILQFFAAVLSACPRVTYIGPSLQISNIPNHYHKKNIVYKHESQFWTTVPATATWKGISYHLAYQPIDTTFAMRRSTQRFARFNGLMLRSYAPYMSVHLDWYLNSSNPGEDYLWYLNHQSGVNHWR